MNWWRAILEGFGSIVDIAGVGTTTNAPKRFVRGLPVSDEEAFQRDADALAGDWEALAGDLQTAIDKKDI